MTNSTPRRVDLTQKVPVRIRSIFNTGKGELLNVSSTGAYVATPMFLLPQAQVKLQIVLRQQRRWVEAEAIVVWENRGTVERRDNLPPGYGLRFVVLPNDTSAVLQELLSGDGLVAPEPAQEPADALATPSANIARTDPLPTETLVPAPAPQVQQDPKDGADRSVHSAHSGQAPPTVESFEAEHEGPPYRIRRPTVDQHTPDGQPGIFVVSYDRTQEARVGRADTDLRATIAALEGEYAYFYCETIDSLEERFARECELFHRLGGDRGQLDNVEHPKTPAGTELDCPVCVHEKVP